MPVQKVLVVLLHNVLHLVETLLRQLIAPLEDEPDLVIDRVERVEVLLLEGALLGLIDQQGDLIGDLLVVLG